jgi:hypothetical protein
MVRHLEVRSLKINEEGRRERKLREYIRDVSDIIQTHSYTSVHHALNRAYAERKPDFEKVFGDSSDVAYAFSCLKEEAADQAGLLLDNFTEERTIISSVSATIVSGVVGGTSAAFLVGESGSLEGVFAGAAAGFVASVGLNAYGNREARKRERQAREEFQTALYNRWNVALHE